jgi:predicted Rossmann fold flavoprotein
MKQPLGRDMREASAPWDAVVIGAGAAGLFCAGIAGQRGRRVLVLDHAPKLGEKIRISGGGRCNFTNRESGPAHFLSLNSHFCKSALSRFSANDFVALVRRHKIGFHEKHQGQLFCDDSAQDIIQMLFDECEKGRVTLRHPVKVQSVEKPVDGIWRVFTDQGPIRSRSVVVATGGLPVPAIGATDFALKLAAAFDLAVVDPRPALVPLSFTSELATAFTELSGLSVPVRIAAGAVRQRYGQCSFHEDLLLTHKGFSGPAVLQASSYWVEGEEIVIDWVDAAAVDAVLAQGSGGSRLTETVLADLLPARLARVLAMHAGLLGRKWAEVSRKDRAHLRALLVNWRVKPAGTLGWKKAEVMLGGVDTRALDSQTMMAKGHPGLFFIGECVDVTGHLGGHNFQWAWASGHACAQAL